MKIKISKEHIEELKRKKEHYGKMRTNLEVEEAIMDELIAKGVEDGA